MMDKLLRRWPALRAVAMPVIAVAVLLFASTGEAVAQVAPTISKVFAPSSVPVSATSVLTVTVINPNAFPITNVQFSDVMPAGVTLITQTGGTCGTPRPWSTTVLALRDATSRGTRLPKAGYLRSR